MTNPGLEEALYEIESLRLFVRLDLADDAMPNETTILEFSGAC